MRPERATGSLGAASRSYAEVDGWRAYQPLLPPHLRAEGNQLPVEEHLDLGGWVPARPRRSPRWPATEPWWSWRARPGRLVAEHVQRTGLQQRDWLLSNARLALNRNSAGHQWRQVRKAAGLDGYTLHDLRHFYASGVAASGCDVVTVQRALGHSSAPITRGVYSHLWPTAEDRTRAAAGDLMAAAMGARADSLRTETL